MNKLEILKTHLEEIQKFYNQNFTNVQIAKIFNCRANDVYITCKRYGLHKNYRIEHKNLQIDYFKKIDTIEKAYWLGFLYADGYINPTNRFVLALSTKDLEHLKKFCDCIGINKDKIKIRYHNNKSKSTSCSIIVSKKEFSFYLGTHGCVNKKSKIIRFPFLSLPTEDLKLAFLLGYYDGDGMERGSAVCSGSLEFLKDIKSIFNIPNEIKIRNSKGTLFELTLGMLLKEKMNDIYSFGLKRKQGKLKYKYDKTLIHYNARFNQKRKFEISKEDLNNLINIQKKSYREIGKMFNVCDNSIKKRAIKLGINIPKRKR